MSTPSGAVWLKSSYSGGEGGNCLEWAPGEAALGRVPIRDSKTADGPQLTFGTDAFTAFIGGVRNGTL